METGRKPSSSSSQSVPNLALQRRVAFSRIDRNTGSRSPGELPMIRRTSEVAVCCSSDSPSSWNSRAFWIASTDWAEKVLSSSMTVVGKSPGALRRTTSAPTTSPETHERHQ